MAPNLRRGRRVAYRAVEKKQSACLFRVLFGDMLHCRIFHVLDFGDNISHEVVGLQRRIYEFGRANLPVRAACFQRCWLLDGLRVRAAHQPKDYNLAAKIQNRALRRTWNSFYCRFVVFRDKPKYRGWHFVGHIKPTNVHLRWFDDYR